MPLWGKTLILKRICIGIKKVRNGQTHQASFVTNLNYYKTLLFSVGNKLIPIPRLSNKTNLK